eukprot:771222-Amphidinium_carterae.4
MRASLKAFPVTSGTNSASSDKPMDLVTSMSANSAPEKRVALSAADPRRHWAHASRLRWESYKTTKLTSRRKCSFCHIWAMIWLHLHVPRHRHSSEQVYTHGMHDGGLAILPGNARCEPPNAA